MFEVPNLNGPLRLLGMFPDSDGAMKTNPVCRDDLSKDVLAASFKGSQDHCTITPQADM